WSRSLKCAGLDWFMIVYHQIIIIKRNLFIGACKVFRKFKVTLAQIYKSSSLTRTIFSAHCQFINFLLLHMSNILSFIVIFESSDKIHLVFESAFYYLILTSPEPRWLSILMLLDISLVSNLVLIVLYPVYYLTKFFSHVVSSFVFSVFIILCSYVFFGSNVKILICFLNVYLITICAFYLIYSGFFTIINHFIFCGHECCKYPCFFPSEEQFLYTKVRTIIRSNIYSFLSCIKNYNIFLMVFALSLPVNKNFYWDHISVQFVISRSLGMTILIDIYLCIE
ncbi:hypothetical protein L9F63_017922, partial [Diploptera punctata]